MEDNKTDFKDFSMTKPSATFDWVDVSEIDLRSLFKSQMVGALSKGEMSAVKVKDISDRCR